jgi:HlyD family secretion protein
MATMKRGVLRATGLGLAILAVAGASVLAFVRPGSPSAAAARIELVAAKRGTISATVSAAGSGISADTRELAFSAAGTVERIYVQPGDKVEIGDLLARIDDVPARETYDAAEAALTAAEDVLTKAEKAEEAKTAATTGPPQDPTARRAPRPGDRRAEPPTGPHPNPTGKPATRPPGKPTCPPRPSTRPTGKPTARPTARPTAGPTATVPEPDASAPTGRIEPADHGPPPAARAGSNPAPSLPSGPHSRPPGHPLSPAPVPPPTATTRPTPTAGPEHTPPAGPTHTPTPSRAPTCAAPDLSPSARPSPEGMSRRPTGRATAGPPMTVARAKADLTKARNDHEDAQDALGGLTIKAPTAGTVLTVAGDVGTQAGTGAFITLGDLDELQVEARFSQTDTGLLKIGQPAEVSLATRRGKHYQGTVTRIAPTATTDGALVTYAVRIAFDDPPAGLLIGQSAIAEVTIEKSADTVFVPARAVRTGAGGSATVTVRTAAGDTEHKVRTGLRDDLSIEITSGLPDGAQIVLPGTTTPDLTFPGL